MNLFDILLPKWRPSTWFILLIVNIIIFYCICMNLLHIYSVDEFTKYDIPHGGRGSLLFEVFAYFVYIDWGLIGFCIYYAILFGIVSFFMIRSFRKRKKKKVGKGKF